MCIHMCMCIYVYVHTHTCVCACVRVCVCVSILSSFYRYLDSDSRAEVQEPRPGLHSAIGMNSPRTNPYIELEHKFQ